MNVNFVYPPQPARRARVMVLHGSGAAGSQRCTLAEALGMIAMAVAARLVP
jgi:hypothetical protein